MLALNVMEGAFRVPPEFAPGVDLSARKVGRPKKNIGAALVPDVGHAGAGAAGAGAAGAGAAGAGAA